jgi:NADH-quinone oxidoreductase subunit K
VHIVYPAVVSALLFSIGVYGVLARRNTILVLMSVELMLNAVNLNLVAFDVWLGDRLHSGQVLTLFVIVIAAAEVGLGLAIVLALYRNRRTVDLDHLRDLAEPADNPDAERPVALAQAERASTYADDQPGTRTSDRPVTRADAVGGARPDKTANPDAKPTTPEASSSGSGASPTAPDASVGGSGDSPSESDASPDDQVGERDQPTPAPDDGAASNGPHTPSDPALGDEQPAKRGGTL